MENGIHTVCSEQGRNLSGGQRARLSLSRCFYQNRDIFLLDDPLKALDKETAKNIMENAFIDKFKETTRVLTTSIASHAWHADRVIIMKKGEIIFNGGYEEATKTEYYKKVTKKTVADDNNSPATVEMEEVKTLDSGIRLSVDYEKVFMESLNNSVMTMSEEVKESGRVSLKVIKSFFFGYGGFLGIFPCILLLILGHSLSMYGIVLVNSFLVHLDKMDFSEKMEALSIIGWISIITFLLIQIVELSFKLLGTSFSETLHSKMVMSILHAKTVEFHDATPMGVIVNRFTNDIDFIDRNLAELCYLIFLPTSELALATYTYFAVVTGVVFKIGFFFYLLMIIATQNYYLKASNNLTRHATAIKSPIVHLSLGIGTGIAHIRALRIEKFFSRKCKKAVDNSVKYYPLIFGLEAGYNYWVALCNFMCVYIPGTAFVSYSILMTGGSTKTLNVTLLKLFMSNAKKIGSNIIQVIKALNKLESKLVYVERCRLYTELEPEANYFNYIK